MPRSGPGGACLSMQCREERATSRAFSLAALPKARAVHAGKRASRAKPSRALLCSIPALAAIGAMLLSSPVLWPHRALFRPPFPSPLSLLAENARHKQQQQQKPAAATAETATATAAETRERDASSGLPKARPVRWISRRGLPRRAWRQDAAVPCRFPFPGKGVGRSVPRPPSPGRPARPSVL